MREIKFRFWNIEYDNRGEEVGRMIFISLRNKRGHLQDAYIQGRLMQYTGLKDKNGIEIYEGDIIEYILNQEGWDLCNHTYLADGSKREGVVGYSSGTLGVVSTRREYIEYKLGMLLPFQLFTRKQCVKVVGSIYENKELLDA